MNKINCPACLFVIETEEKLFEEKKLRCPDCSVDLEIIEIEGDNIKVEEVEVSEEYWGD